MWNRLRSAQTPRLDQSHCRRCLRPWHRQATGTRLRMCAAWHSFQETQGRTSFPFKQLIVYLALRNHASSFLCALYHFPLLENQVLYTRYLFEDVLAVAPSRRSIVRLCGILDENPLLRFFYLIRTNLGTHNKSIASFMAHMSSIILILLAIKPPQAALTFAISK